MSPGLQNRDDTLGGGHQHAAVGRSLSNRGAPTQRLVAASPAPHEKCHPAHQVEMTLPLGAQRYAKGTSTKRWGEGEGVKGQSRLCRGAQRSP